MKRLLVLAFITGFFSCTDEGKTRQVLMDQGYMNIVMTGYSYGTCAEDDNTCTGFEATSPNGTRVRGAVSCGLWCGL